jgi:uncharacterized membrane protein
MAFCMYAGALALRHLWFQTSAWDLAIFDQAVHLIGQGLPAQSSLLGHHILADHGAFVLYPLGWLSRLIPSPALLFLVQSAALAAAVFPLAALARWRGLSRSATAASLAMLLLYPVVFNTAIFDFHPETLAFPLVMQALWWLERRAAGDELRVVVVLLLALTCKVGLALLVLAIGAMLLLQGRRLVGGCLLGLAVAWFAVVGAWLIPRFGGEQAELLRHAGKFGLGQADLAAGHIDWLDVLGHLISQVFSLASGEYLLLLLLPVLYVLLHRQRRRFFVTLLPFGPLMLLNLAAARPAMKDLVHHYSLLLVPFLALAVQQTLAPGRHGIGDYPRWLQGRIPAVVIAWALLAFLLFSRISFFLGSFQEHRGHLGAMREALAQIEPKGALLVSNNFAPHVSHRQRLSIVSAKQMQRLDHYDQILLDARHPGFEASPTLLRKFRQRLQAMPEFRLIFDRDAIWLFQR